MYRSAPTALIIVLGTVVAACSGSATTEPPRSMEVTPTESAEASERATLTAEPTLSAEPEDPLLGVELTDVRSGETFTLGELAATSGPVLLEPMAVWCSNCRAQQHEVVRAHEIGEFASVSLDVDLSELPSDLAAYADQEGFDWWFAMADVDLYRSLQDRFGVAVTNPPSTPLIIIAADGSIRPLEFGTGTRSAEELLSELGAA